jgi:hypothetical protein
MARSKTMGIGAMFVVLVIAVAILPMIVRFVGTLETSHFVVQGFQDIAAEAEEAVLKQNTVSLSGNVGDGEVSNIPSISGYSTTNWHPDSNTNYICRSPNDSGEPCPEGHFCDGVTQACIPTSVGGPVPSTGYFS